MFRSTTIIRELAIELGSSYIYIKTKQKLRHYLLCGGVAACPGMACVLCAVQSETPSRSAQHTIHTPYRDMLPHHRITNNDVTFVLF